MNKSFKLALGLTILAMILIAVPSALALDQPIGTSQQNMPFESNPTAVEPGSRTVTGPLNAMDGDPYTTFMSTTYGLSNTYWGVTTFTRPSAIGREEFPIGSVTIHIQYAAPALGADDKYRLVYIVGATTFVLQAWTGSPTTASSTNFAVPLPSTTLSGGTQLSRSWGEVSSDAGGWDWGKIEALRVRAEFQLTSTNDAKAFRIYEIWLTVYDTAPPDSGATVSMQPGIITNMPAEDGTGIGVFFIDIYAHNMIYGSTGLQIAEFTFSFDPTVLQLWDPMGLGTPVWGTYWPWVSENWFTFDNSIGQVSASLGIATAHVLVDYGLQGSFPVARIWFAVIDTTGTASSTFHFDVSTMVAPGGFYIVNTPYDGLYGVAPVPEFPFGIGVLTILAPLTLIGYLWRRRKKVD